MEPTGPIRTGPTEPTTARARPEPDLPSLAALVGPDLGGFLDHHLGKAAFQRRLPYGAAAALFGWARLNQVLAEHRLSPPRLRLERAGADATRGLFRERRTRRGRVLHDLDPAVLTARLREGATLILDAAHELSPPLQRLCAGLSAEFVASSQANLYASWGETQGFDVHWDDHEVFVVQVEGRKRWSLYGSTRPFPSARDRHADHPRPDTPLEELLLEPGDMLYLPRGYWHAAVGLGEPTLHLTIGLTRKTGSDFLHWLADEALTEAAARADLPLEGQDEALGHRVAGLIASTLGAADPAELGRRYRRHVEASLSHRPQLSLPLIGQAQACYPPDLEIGLADGGCSLRPGEDGAAVVLRHRGVDYTLDAALEAPIRALVAGEPIAYRRFEEAASPAARPLVGGFVGEMLARGVFVATPKAQP